MHIGYKIGLIDKEMYESVEEKKHLIKEELKRLDKIYISIDSKRIKALDFLRRPESKYSDLSEVAKLDLPWEVKEEIEIEAKYQGYIQKQLILIEQQKKLEDKKIPINLDYNKIKSLSVESRQKLSQIRPQTIGQALRIPGIRPSDISILLVYLEKTFSFKK
jgi:tRNA uridine 5-carboxymethylaminomethyl modification enzyme